MLAAVILFCSIKFQTQQTKHSKQNKKSAKSKTNPVDAIFNVCLNTFVQQKSGQNVVSNMPPK
jgi:hypothetical protein